MFIFKELLIYGAIAAGAFLFKPVVEYTVMPVINFWYGMWGH